MNGSKLCERSTGLDELLPERLQHLVGEAVLDAAFCFCEDAIYHTVVNAVVAMGLHVEEPEIEGDSGGGGERIG